MRRRRRRARDVSIVCSIMMNRARRTNDARDVSRAMDDARGESDGESESESESDSEGSRAGEAREWMPKYRLDSDVVERLMTAETSKGEGAADVGPPMFAVGRRARRRRGGKKRSKRRRDSKRKKRVRERIIVSDHSTEKIQNETVAVLKGTRTEKQILKANQDIEVVILGLETVGLLKSKYKKTYVQVKWKPHHAESRKVKTFRREDTDNPIWGTRGKFVFQNCEPNGEFKVKVKEVRSLKRKVVVGTARLPSDVIPRDGSRVDLRVSLKTGLSRKTKAILNVRVGQATFAEPAVGEQGYWPAMLQDGEMECKTVMQSDRPIRELRLPTYIVVTILNARNLFSADTFGASDPYVKVGFDCTPLKERYKTSHRNDTNCPEWNTRFLMRTPGERGGALVFTMWDKDYFSADDFLGCAALPIEAIPSTGDVIDLDLQIKGRITADAAGEVCVIHPRAPDDLGLLRVQVSTIVGYQTEEIVKTINEGKISRSEGTDLARNVHVSLIAARSLFKVDSGAGSCDAFAYIRMDNAPKDEFCRTDTINNTLHPVWNNGLGQTFTLISRPGCAEVILTLYDRNLLSKTVLGRASIPLSSLPSDGSWKQIVAPLYGIDEHRGDLIGSSDGSSPWNAPEKVKGEIVVRLSATRPPFANMPEPPPVCESERYINQHETNKYLYIQAVKCHGLPIRYAKASTNAHIRMSLNTHKYVLDGQVQSSVVNNFEFKPEVLMVPKTKISSTLTIQLVSQKKSVYGSRLLSKVLRRTAKIMGVYSFIYKPDDSSYNENEEMSSTVDGDEGEDDERDNGIERFTKGNGIGYVQIPVANLAVGDLLTYRLQLQPMFKAKSWLQTKEDELGELEIKVGCGYSKTKPKDLRSMSQVARPSIGKVSFNIVSVVGDRTPYQNFAPLIDNVLAMGDENEKFGRNLYATVMWDGREGNIKSTHERFNFAVTEITGDVRVLFKCPDLVTGGDQILGAVSIPVSSIVENRCIDSWFNITPPNSSFLTEQEMANPNHAMCTYLRSMKYPNDWQGYARIKLSFETTRELSRWEWYLKQRPMARKKAHIPDTIDGVLTNIQQMVESLLAPMKMFARAAIFFGTSRRDNVMLKIAWCLYHTLCCLTFRREIVTSFILLWIVPGLFFTGYCSSFIANELRNQLSPFVDDEDEIETLRREVHTMVKNRNRRMREIKDEYMVKMKLDNLRQIGRDIDISKSSVEAIMKQRRLKRARAGVNEELPDISLSILPQNVINQAIAVFTASNPAEIVLKIIQKIIWNLLKIVKDAGTTLVRIDKVLTSGGPRLMPGVCKQIGEHLEKFVSATNRPVTLLSWDNPALTKYSFILTFGLTFATCCAIWAVKKCIFLVDRYSIVRLWHFVWLIGILPTLPKVSPHLMRASVAIDYTLQLTVGPYIAVRPISLSTIKAIRDILAREVEDDYQAVRDAIITNLETTNERAYLQREMKLKKEAKARFAKSSSNPASWLKSAYKRAPTSLSIEHKTRTRALMRDGGEDAPDVRIFRRDVDVGRAGLHAFSKLLAFAMQVPVRAVRAPIRIIQLSTETRMDVSDTLSQMCTLNWLRGGRRKLPFGECRADVIPSSRDDVVVDTAYSAVEK